MWFHPNATLKDAAHALKLDYAYVRAVWSRLRRRKDFDRLCPLCFHATRVGTVCTNCGADFTQPLPGLYSENSYPAIRLLRGKGLGTPFLDKYEYRRMKFANRRGALLKTLAVDDTERKNLEHAKLMLAKRLPKNPELAEIAAHMIEKEFIEYKTKYGLSVTAKVASALVRTVLKELKHAGLLAS